MIPISKGIEGLRGHQNVTILSLKVNVYNNSANVVNIEKDLVLHVKLNV